MVNILFGNRPRAGFEINHRQYCLRTNKKKINIYFFTWKVQYIKTSRKYTAKFIKLKEYFFPRKTK